ncbi:MAG: hypothetical protein MZW92_77215 [Comamonadaceae bacterium]|nr:hypothetical protein [Comamonadaceae bacterium]
MESIESLNIALEKYPGHADLRLATTASSSPRSPRASSRSRLPGSSTTAAATTIICTARASNRPPWRSAQGSPANNRIGPAHCSRAAAAGGLAPGVPSAAGAEGGGRLLPAHLNWDFVIGILARAALELPGALGGQGHAVPLALRRPACATSAAFR